VSLLKRVGVLNCALLITALTVVFGTVSVRQARAEEGIDRKVKVKVSPSYPEFARKLGLTGTVKLEVVIATNGSVKETKVIGGHPILVQAAVEAVKKWKFEPASEESTGTLVFNFVPEY
jgi:TonB family protein